MKKQYALLLAMLLAFSGPALAQYEFLDAPRTGTSTVSASNGLGPCIQDFNSIGTGVVNPTSNGVVAAVGTGVNLPGIMVGYKLPNTGAYVPLTSIAANDGGLSAGGAYNFGTTGAVERAIGGIAAGPTGTVVGTGYVSLRLKNNSSATIKNLDIRYALEQWFNSGLSKAAFFEGSYRIYRNGATGFKTADLSGATAAGSAGADTWTAITTLKIEAPATNGVLGKVDGNSTTYRRTAQARVTNVDMKPGDEAVVRFDYAFDSNTNNNGLAFDDIVIYPETEVFYSTANGELDATNGTWSQNADNSTFVPAVNFAANNVTYYVRGTDESNRINGASWEVTGQNARVVVGDGITAAKLTLGAKPIKAVVDVSSQGTLQLTATPANLTLGNLSKGSTVQYAATGTNAQKILPATYAKLALSGDALKILDGPVIVGEGVTMNGTAANPQAAQLGNYNLTLLRNATVTGQGQLVTNGTGVVRATVSKGVSAAVLFPVATSSVASSYTPVELSPGTADLDETYAVRVAEGVFKKYSNDVGSQPVENGGNVDRTWFISRESAGKVAATLKLEWNKALEQTGFNRDMAYIDHYSGTAWDVNKAGSTSSGSSSTWSVSRTNVTSFSPFAVTSNTRGPLPVQLLAFAANRAGRAVHCSWTTAMELNSARFVVERSTDEGRQFVAVGTVDAAGTSTQRRTYTFTDASAQAAACYYRLRQEDLDGTVAYSQVVVVGVLADNHLIFSVVPNPGAGVFQLRGLNADAVGRVYTVLGTPVQVVAADGRFDLSAQPAGVYLLQVQTPRGLRTQRVVKQ